MGGALDSDPWEYPHCRHHAMQCEMISVGFLADSIHTDDELWASCRTWPSCHRTSLTLLRDEEQEEAVAAALHGARVETLDEAILHWA
jgi:hypothetical protein